MAGCWAYDLKHDSSVISLAGSTSDLDWISIYVSVGLFVFLCDVSER